MFKSKYCIVTVVFAVSFGGIVCDYYTSIYGLDKLLEAEEYLLESLQDFMETKRNFKEQFVKTLSDIEDEHDYAKRDALSYVSNPISAFKLIKRFVVDWTLVEKYIHTDLNTEGIPDSVTNFTRFLSRNFELPTEDDLIGAALGLLRIQETYVLNVSDLAEGRILGTKYGSEMTASDCLELGLRLLQAGNYKNSLKWILEAKDKYNKTSSISKELTVDILQHLFAVYLNLGNAKMALSVNNEILAIDPTKVHALKSKAINVDKASKDKNYGKISGQRFGKSEEPSLKDLYEMTCRGERYQTPTEQRPLRCMYETYGKSYRLIGPFRVEQLNLHPLIVQYYDVITDSDMENSIEKGQPIIKPTKNHAYESTYSLTRTSKSGWLLYKDHDFLHNIANVLTDITGLSLSTAEPLQIVNYGIGGHNGPHWDCTNNPDKDFGVKRGNRMATALFYISDVELGGATAFPFLKVAVQPVKGSMVLWYNLHESLETDFRTKHVGCPVLKGSKWILTEWFHERGQEFLRPCSLEQQGYVSEYYKCSHIGEFYYINKNCRQYTWVLLANTKVLLCCTFTRRPIE